MRKMVIDRRIMDSDDIRRLCVEHNWYTKGDNMAYDNLLGCMVDKFNRANDETAQNKVLEEIAINIVVHSDMMDELHEATLTDIEELLEEVEFILLNYHGVTYTPRYEEV